MRVPAKLQRNRASWKSAPQFADISFSLKVSRQREFSTHTIRHGVVLAQDVKFGVCPNRSLFSLPPCAALRGQSRLATQSCPSTAQTTQGVASIQKHDRVWKLCVLLRLVHRPTCASKINHCVCNHSMLSRSSIRTSSAPQGETESTVVGMAAMGSSQQRLLTPLTARPSAD